MSQGPDSVEGLLRELAPRALGAVVRRYGRFADAEDAVQEALIAAATRWPDGNVPDQPLAWLVRVASRRMADVARSETSRRRREAVTASWTREPAAPVSGRDDTLALFFMCCHPSLSPTSAVALTLRALGGLTTAQIAAAFLVPEPTMAQRITRAKRTVNEAAEPLALPDDSAYATRLRLVLRVVYLIYNEGYASTSSADLGRTDIASEGLRLGRLLHRLAPEESEVTGLLALMLLIEARRPARTAATGALIPLDEQDRSLWHGALIEEGTRLATSALEQSEPTRMGEYAVQASIAALHDAAPTFERTDWARILSLYTVLERITDNPVVTLNRAVAVAMVEGPDAGLCVLDTLTAQGSLVGSHRMHAVRAHLLERKGDRVGARHEYVAAASGSTNVRERDYLTLKAAGLGSAIESAETPPGPCGVGSAP